MILNKLLHIAMLHPKYIKIAENEHVTEQNEHVTEQNEQHNHHTHMQHYTKQTEKLKFDIYLLSDIYRAAAHFKQSNIPGLL